MAVSSAVSWGIRLLLASTLEFGADFYGYAIHIVD
jgi:hypothetical protein